MKRNFPSSTLRASLLGAALVGCGLSANAHQNPIDPVSNPHKLDYSDVDARRPDFNEPFLRDGIVSQPAGFHRVQAGLPLAQVQSMLGEPLKKQSGERGQELDYNFKFRMQDSENFLVCQYKVLIDPSTQAVRESTWRRQQCLDLVSASAPNPRAAAAAGVGTGAQ